MVLGLNKDEEATGARAGPVNADQDIRLTGGATLLREGRPKRGVRLNACDRIRGFESPAVDGTGLRQERQQAVLSRQVTQEAEDVGCEDILHVRLVRGELAVQQSVDYGSLLLEKGTLTPFGIKRKSGAARFIAGARARENWLCVPFILGACCESARRVSRAVSAVFRRCLGRDGRWVWWRLGRIAAGSCVGAEPVFPWPRRKQAVAL